MDSGMKRVEAALGGLVETPTDHFQAELRGRLVTACREKASAYPSLGQARPIPWWRTLSVRLAAAAMAISLTGAGTAWAAGSSMPDSALYPLKRAIERVELALAGNAHSQALRHLQAAAARIEEARAMRDAGKTALAGRSLSSGEAELSAAEGLALGLSPDARALLEARIAVLRARHAAVLREVLAKVPGAARKGLLRAIERSTATHLPRALRRSEGSAGGAAGSGKGGSEGSTGSRRGNGQSGSSAGGGGSGAGQGDSQGGRGANHGRGQGKGQAPEKDAGGRSDGNPGSANGAGGRSNDGER